MRVYILLLTLFLASCVDLTGENTGANDLETDKLIGGLAYLELEEGKALLSGTMNTGEAHSFKMNFELPTGKSLRFFVYSNENLTNGLVITFSRVDGKTMANFSLNGNDDTRELVNVGEKVNLVLDVHNDHEDAHILLWNAVGPFDDSEECVENEGCLYNSEFYTFPNEGPWGTQGRSPGVFWGVQGDRNLIKKLEGPLKAVSDA